jgi:SNF2 family DNA or RNA helicase
VAAMAIVNQFVREFDAIARAGGAEDFEAGLSSLALLAKSAAQFKISEPQVKLLPSQTASHVVLAWNEADQANLFGVHCSCAPFQKHQELCHHAWTALLDFDQSQDIELLESKSALEGKSLKLKRLTNEAAAEVMNAAIDVNATKAWPLAKLAPKGFVEFTQNQKSGEFKIASLGFDYGDYRILSASHRKEFLDRAKQTRIKRNQTAEKELLKNLRGDLALKKLEASKLSSSELKSFISERQDQNWQFLIDGKKVVPLEVNGARLKEVDGRYEFTAQVVSPEQTFSLRDLLASGSSKEALPTLSDGSPALLPEEWSKRLDILWQGATLSKDGALCFSRTSLPLFRSAFEGADFISVSDEAKSVFTTLSALGRSGQADAPIALKASLRSYQAEGLFWLLKMSDSGFGGILADDMGLGKTVQIISYLLARKAHFRLNPDAQKPCLVVLPKSLVSNWHNEIEKFGPTLRVLDFAGPNRVIFRPQHFDVVLTTYHVLKNEVDRLQTVDFDTIILDEAQAIKNPTSQISKAVLLLKARQRFALTGTPIENSLRDLFSLLNFTNPGLIPSSFDRAYGERKSPNLSKSVTDKLAATVRPFILRRTKKQVLTELPDKTEQVLICDMDGPQKSLYDKTRKHFKVQLKENAKETPNGPKSTRVFEALLRLRQISCHPSLIGDAGKGVESAKVEMLLEHLEDIQASGHKALVFSQFTSFLDLLKPELEKAGIPFEHLDGQTRNRGAVVDRFNSNPKTTVFLISLKAGGTGLNLTTASYVFLMDPWWNPAIESQAIDRAYRMGQKQKVMAYRLIAKGSIEEKILKLQDQKRNLANALVTEDKPLGSALSLDDLEFLLEP